MGVKFLAGSRATLALDEQPFQQNEKMGDIGNNQECSIVDINYVLG